MSQIIKTEHHGELEFDKTWVVSGGAHIGKLTNGGYCFLGGAPVLLKDIKKVIPVGKELDEALEWWEHKDDEKNESSKKITISPDGSYTFENGDPITKVSELYDYFEVGSEILDNALLWFTRRQEKEKEKTTEVNEKIQETTEKNVKKFRIKLKNQKNKIKKT